MYNIAIIEDSQDIRRELSDYFTQSGQLQCVLSVDSIERFAKFHRDFMEIDLVLLDLILYNKLGIDGIPIIKQREPLAKIVVFTILDDEEAVFQAFGKGADGYLNKDLSPTELEKRLLVFLEKQETLLSPKAAKHLVNYFHPQEIAANEDLNAQELTIARMLSDGLSYQEIADLLSLTVNGVRYHVKNIYKKLNVHNRRQLRMLFNHPKSERV